jgi:hypothetical protein
MRRRVAALLAAIVTAGCGATPATPAGTGAAECVRGYFDALVRRDWAAAHAALHPDSRARCGRERFELLAQAYRRSLGFEPAEVRLRSCEEHAGEAFAHVVIAGRAGEKARLSRDAVTLRRSAEGWGIVLSERFGKPR